MNDLKNKISAAVVCSAFETRAASRAENRPSYLTDLRREAIRVSKRRKAEFSHRDRVDYLKAERAAAREFIKPLLKEKADA